MAAVAGEMSVNNTAAASLAAAIATGQMMLRIATTATMKASEPATTTGLMATQTHATNGLMLLNISS